MKMCVVGKSLDFGHAGSNPAPGTICLTVNQRRSNKVNILRQGDVLLVKVSSLPEVVAAKKGGEDIILAHGEVTGHAHRIKAPVGKAKLWDAGAERFLQVMERVALTHEEHSAISIDPGIYRVAIQTEYTPSELRRVAD
jgi:hypothetical protein